MEYSRILQKIGLSERESRIYLDLLEHGDSTISDISKRTSLHRPVIYSTLPVLEESSLVTKTVKGKRIRYEAESPEKLKGIMDSFVQSFSGAFDGLVDMYGQREKKPIVRFMEGKKAIQFIYNDVVDSLKKGDTYYRYSSRIHLDKTSGYLPVGYRERVAEKQIQRCVIASESLAKIKKPKLERDIVTIPKKFDLFEDHITKLIYADKVGVIDFNSETVLIIQNAVFARFEEKLFKFLFRFLKEYHGKNPTE